jgi:hypothetical protein
MESCIINFIKKNLFYIILIKIIIIIVIYLSLLSYFFIKFFNYYENKLDILNSKISNLKFNLLNKKKLKKIKINK